MENGRHGTAGMLLKSVCLTETVLVFLLIHYFTDNPENFWIQISISVFFFSLLETFIMIAMREEEKKFSVRYDAMLLLSASGLIVPFLLVPLGRTISVGFPLAMTAFYGFLFPILIIFFGPYSNMSIVKRNSGWLDILMVILALYLLVVGAVAVSEHMDAMPEFYSGGDNYMVEESSESLTVTVHITLVNNGFRDARGIGIVYENRTVYRIDVLPGMSVKTYVFSMEARGEAYQDTYWETVYGPDGDVEYVQRNITKYHIVDRVELNLTYGGEIVDTETIYQHHYYDYYDYGPCDAIYILAPVVGLGLIRKKR